MNAIRFAAALFPAASAATRTSWYFPGFSPFALRLKLLAPFPLVREKLRTRFVQACLPQRLTVNAARPLSLTVERTRPFVFFPLRWSLRGVIENEPTLGAVVSGGLTVVVAGGAGTTNARVAGLGSVAPFASVARTAKVWLPGVRPLKERGEPHEANAPPSSEHAKADDGSSELKANSLPFALSMLVSGGGMLTLRS